MMDVILAGDNPCVYFNQHFFKDLAATPALRRQPLATQSTTWVLLAGLPATGKSTLAQKLAALLDRSVILDKDRVRDTLFPGLMTDYTPEQDSLCMRAMLEAAAYLTNHHLANFVLFDGRTFSRASHIEEVLDAAARAGAQWRILHLTSSDEVATKRLNAPDPDHPARNRDEALYFRLKAAFEPIIQLKLNLDTSAEIDPIVDRALAYIRS